MATTTPNIGLTLPAGTEGWKRSVINGNFTILDTKIGAVGNTPLQTQINTLSSQITSVSKANGTANTTYCSSVPPYMKMGKVCIISGDAVVTTAIPNNGVYVLGTGYPTPQTHDTEWTYWGVMIDRSGGNSYRVNIAADGLRVAYNGIPTGSYNVFIVYFANSAT